MADRKWATGVEEDIKWVKGLRRLGHSYPKIEAITGIPQTTVYYYCNPEKYQEQLAKKRKKREDAELVELLNKERELVMFLIIRNFKNKIVNFFKRR